MRDWEEELSLNVADEKLREGRLMGYMYLPVDDKTAGAKAAVVPCVCIVYMACAHNGVKWAMSVQGGAAFLHLGIR